MGKSRLLGMCQTGWTKSNAKLFPPDRQAPSTSPVTQRHGQWRDTLTCCVGVEEACRLVEQED